VNHELYAIVVVSVSGAVIESAAENSVADIRVRPSRHSIIPGVLGRVDRLRFETVCMAFSLCATELPAGGGYSPKKSFRGGQSTAAMP
jgi:hypothetical protein